MTTILDRSRFLWPWPMTERLNFWGALALALLAGFAAGVASTTALRAEPPLVEETVLLRTDPAGMDGKELIVSRFETGLGSAIVQVRGKPPMTVPAGATATSLPGKVHAGRNASATAPREGAADLGGVAVASPGLLAH